MSSEPITFLAVLPDIQSAIRIGKDTARVQLEVSASDRAAIKALMDCQGQVLSVAIVAHDPIQTEQPHAD